MEEPMSELGAVETLIKIVEDYVRPYLIPGRKAILPEGLVLEMHPSTRHMIMRNLPREAWFMTPPTQAEPQVFPAEVPVKISTDLPKYGWRLAIITVQEINGGVMPHG